MAKEIFYVYQHLKKDTDEVFYIGKGSGYRARVKSQRSKHWNNVVNKYGYDIEIVQDELSEDEAFQLEVELITKIGLDNLVNMTNGGEGVSGRIWKPSDETKRKMSETAKGRILSNKTKKKMSKVRIGYKHPQKAIDNMIGVIGGVRLILDISTGIYYESITEAANVLNMKRTTLNEQLIGRNKNKTNLRYV